MIRRDVLLLIKLALIVVGCYLFGWTDARYFYAKPGTTAGEIIRARGYKARDYQFFAPDGYRLTLTRATNPLFNKGEKGLANRDPILFVHGVLEDSGVFVINSNLVKGPQDFSKKNLNDVNDIKFLKKQASARTLPFLAMDFGHEVWLLNRRGFPGSQHKESLGNRRRLGSRRLDLRMASLHEVDSLEEEENTHDDWDEYELGYEGHEYDYSEDYDEYCDYEYDFDDDDDDSDRNNLSGRRHSHRRKHERKTNKPQRMDEMAEQVVDNDEIIADDKSRGESRLSLSPYFALPDAFFQNGKLIENIIFSFDKGYWAFSLDQQAKFDLPLAIGHVLNATGSAKVATATHSAGGGLLLMALSLYPSLTDKLAANVMWSPAFCMGQGQAYKQLQAVRPYLEKNDGPIPPTWITPPIQGVLGLLCNLPLAPKALCEFFNDFMNGPSGGKEPMYPEFMSTQFHSTSSREMAQFLQSASFGGLMHFYDYKTERNKQVYHGQTVPPAYNASAITSKTISFYSTPSDALIKPEDIERLRSLLRVPSKLQVISTYFNHVGYFFHKQNAELAIIPALQDIHNVSNKR